MKTLKLIQLFMVAVLLFGCEKALDTNESFITNQENVLTFRVDPVIPNEDDPLKYSELNSILIEDYKVDQQMNWKDVSDYHLWSAVKNSNSNLVAIGYVPTGIDPDLSENIHLIDVSQNNWVKTREALVQFVLDELNAKQETKLTKEDIVDEIGETLPSMVLKVSDYEVLAKLRRCENVRFVEPIDYDEIRAIERSSAFGCGGSGSASSSDYSTISPNVKVPWNFYNMNIPAAWSNSTGSGITIGVIDAGFSTSQSGLHSGFATGQSTGRSSSFSYTYGSSAYNSCVHGTGMAGLATGPRNSSGNSVGAAYQASLVGVRACEDVLLNSSSERKSVKNALVNLGNNSSVRIISMSIGWAFGSSYLKDGTDYAYNKGKLIFAAGGTSFSLTTWFGVIYPAKYSKVVAVTGVKENNSKCSVCHWGGDIEFTVIMERNASSSRTSVTLGLSGNSPIYMGGSSAATATSAGIAALVWSANPSLSRDQVRSIMRQTAQYYPGKDGNRGYGLLNANAAVLQAINTP